MNVRIIKVRIYVIAESTVELSNSCTSLSSLECLNVFFVCYTS